MFTYGFSNVSKHFICAFFSSKSRHAPKKRESNPFVKSLLKIEWNYPCEFILKVSRVLHSYLASYFDKFSQEVNLPELIL